MRVDSQGLRAKQFAPQLQGPVAAAFHLRQLGGNSQPLATRGLRLDLGQQAHGPAK